MKSSTATAIRSTFSPSERTAVWIDERHAIALLKSALARPQQHFADAKAVDIIEMAGIVSQ
jgi:hypothetical protein